jgi:hypothetical protein
LDLRGGRLDAHGGRAQRAVRCSQLGTVVIEQRGSDERGPQSFTVYGGVADLVITKLETGEQIKFLTGQGVLPVLGSTLNFDVINHRVNLNGGAWGTQDWVLDYNNSQWPLLTPGTNTFQLTGTTKTIGTTGLSVYAYDTWI